MSYNLQVRLHEQRDADVIAWLDEQANKSETVRRALRAAIAPSPTPSPTWEIRSVIEAVLDEKLAGLALVRAGQDDIAPNLPEEDPELSAVLDGMF